MKTFFVTLLLVLTNIVFAQITYNGPAAGSVESGVTVTTDSYTKKAVTVAPRVKLFINQEIEEYENNNEINTNTTKQYLPLFSSKGTNDFADSVFIVNEFQGAPHRNSIPPDPDIAVGPEYVVHVVNTYFRIYDKERNLLKDIPASTWYSSVYGAANPFDPKVIYDHYANRWVMVWLDMNSSASEGYYLISVSDDDNPLGTWYNWALPSHVNGSTPSGGWADYEGVGFDDKAIYITSNLFSFSGSFQGTRIRIIDKTNLYADTPGQVTWNDLWSITYPTSSYSCFGIRPAIMLNQDPDGKYYFAVHSPYSTGTNVGVYILSDPLTNPSLEGYAVSVNTYFSPPNAQQLGGSSIPLESGGKNLRNEPVVKDGILYMVHSVKANNVSGVHLVEVNLSTLNADVDDVFADGTHYYIYPALTVDSRGNVFVTYSRSSTEEYVGAGFFVFSSTWSYSNDILFEPGYGNYVVDYGSGRNRWGDYMGACIDPANPNSAWFATEHVAGTNQWGVRIAQVRAYPYDEATAYFSSDSIYFGQVEVGSESDIQNLVIKNYGSQPLEISSIVNSIPDVQILSDIEFPVTLNAYDSLLVSMKFVPSVDTVYENYLSVLSGSNVIKNIKMVAEGYEIRETEQYTMYGTTGNYSNGVLAKINLTNGEATEVGPTNYKPVRSLTINPNDNHLYALAGSSYDENPTILVMTSEDGSAYPYATANVALDAIAFDNNGVLYGAGTDSKLYQLDLNADTAIYIADIPMRFAAITFRHTTNEMFASSRSNAARDLIMKVNVTTGDTTQIGRTGRNNVMFGLSFDNNDVLYASEGRETQMSNLVQIDTETGEGTLIGSMGIKGVIGLAYAMDGIVGLSENQNVYSFKLEQNYPNPFNPETIIKFSIPRSQNVMLKVYDLLGREVATLVNGFKNKGNYSVKFNAENLASGLYIYRLSAEGISISRKMILLK